MQVRPINPINVVSFCNLSSQVENTSSQLSHLEMNNSSEEERARALLQSLKLNRIPLGSFYQH